jgi:hypothetical protein
VCLSGKKLQQACVSKRSTRPDLLLRYGKQMTDGGAALGDNGFHEHFDEPDDDPLEFIAWCYSGLSRLREVRYGTVVGRTVLEGLEAINTM